MRKFVHTPEFRELGVGFALDEGIASPGEDFPIFYGERSGESGQIGEILQGRNEAIAPRKTFKIRIVCPGSPGHGSMFLEDTAGEKARIVINRWSNGIIIGLKMSFVINIIIATVITQPLTA